MILKEGNMFARLGVSDTVVLVTTNSAVKISGELVMGKGAALEAQRHAPGIAADFGQTVMSACGAGGFYGVIFSTSSPRLGAFQVKWHWSQDANINLIQASTAMLKVIAMMSHGKRFNLNFPGIGYGGLKRGRVLSIIKDLPDNVAVWELPG